MYKRLFAGGVLALLATSVALAGDTVNATPAPVKKANYELAAQWTSSKVGKMIFDLAVTPHWLDSGDRFWYTFETNKGRKFWMVDPAKKNRSLVFDPVKLAAQLTGATGLPYDSQHLPITTIRFVKSDSTIQFDVVVPRDAIIPGEKKPPAGTVATDAQQNGGDDDPQQQGGRGGRGAAANPNQKTLYFEYELATSKLNLLDARPPRKAAWASMSPDGQWVVFAKNHNLYMMDAANYAKAQKKADDTSIVETQLTTDGIEDNGYGGGRGMGGDQQQQQQDGQQNEGDAQNQDNKNARVSAGNVSWSRDSKKFALVRRDSTKVEKLWVISSLANPRPTLETYRYAMPGDKEIPQSRLEIFDVASKDRKLIQADSFKDQTLQIEVERPSLRMREEHEKTEALWATPGSDKLYFTRMSRDLHRVDVCSVDTATGDVKPLIQERMNVYIETKPLRVINNGAELVWWSERDGWGHYYLYDSNGTLKSQVTKGEFVAEDVSYIDEKARTMYLTASGREDGENPYFMHFYRANLDGSGVKMLDPGDASHAVLMSDSGHFFVDNASRVNTAPSSGLYDAQGAEVMPLEKVDVTPMLEAGYKFPEPFKVKADDGITDLYGVMYKPFDFDPNKKYPIVEYVYPGPQTESVTQVFSPRSNNIALANLGFIVIEVGNRGGNPHRSKWYHTFGYGNLRDYGLADKKHAVEQLAARYPWIDIDRVGITGHSGGGFMSTAALLIYPDFYKVAVSESGNHENNVYNNTWSEKHHGLKEVAAKDGKVTFEYTIDKNSEIAKNLKGHLMLSTGDIDNNVHPANTIRLMDALIKANKRFDFVMLPGQRHAYGPMAEYFSWVRADYFCKYLLGDFDQSVDMWELNNERQAADKTPPVRQGQQQQQRRQ
ncbi:MAG TPA: DPP IV N-terminal domain-containing protein [Candidatus Sulfopaludibacter sp.]|jgi:dipeptidyl aminopeptidase/acylaminoacyl peptidase|nr:DPP IV N-terminal domain-containing protein [Candidatus Sulfopaludibacter sp.]